MAAHINANPAELTGLDGRYDPALAVEKEVTYSLVCDECGRKRQGTAFELQEYRWNWELSIDSDKNVVVDSSALCGYCNPDVEEQDIGPEDEEPEEELEPWEKASEDPHQKTLGGIDG